MARVLVLYGTTDGQTAKIARAIGGTLREEGVDADVVDARVVSPELGGYAGVVVAASVHAGGYQRAVKGWVRAHARELQGIHTAFVSVCLGILQHDPAVDRELEAISERFIAQTRWRPGFIKTVAGALPYTRYNWLKRLVLKRIVRKAGGDTDTSRDSEYTDWNDLQAFAVAFAKQVVSRVTRAAA